MKNLDVPGWTTMIIFQFLYLFIGHFFHYQFLTDNTIVVHCCNKAFTHQDIFLEKLHIEKKRQKAGLVYTHVRINGHCLWIFSNPIDPSHEFFANQMESRISIVPFF